VPIYPESLGEALDILGEAASTHLAPPTRMTHAHRPLPKGLGEVLDILVGTLSDRLDTLCGMPEPPASVMTDAEAADKWDREHSGDAFLLEPYKVLESHLAEFAFAFAF
jgi:hypothetical protein